MSKARLKFIEVPGFRQKFVVDNIADTVIAESPRHGNGLFTKRVRQPGEALAVLDGQRVDWQSWEAVRARQLYGRDNDDMFMEWNAMAEDTLMIRPFRTKYSFINHSRTPNLRVARTTMTLMVAEPVAAGEELTLDYRLEPLSDAYLNKAGYL